MKTLIIGSFIALVALVVVPQVKAEQPACRDVTTFTPGKTVCYTEHPYSARQRDEGGSRTWTFVLERWAPGWVIVDYKVTKESGFGTTSLPTGSILSSSGNASIVNVTRREIEKLSEVKSQLTGKMQGCVPPVCGEIEGQINKLDREVEKISDDQKTAISAGGNEKISFSYTTYVDCPKVLGIQYCKDGAYIQGKVILYQRYLGDPDSIQRSSSSLVEQSQSLVAAYNKPLEVARDAQKTVPNSVEQSQQTGTTRNDNKPISEESVFQLFYKFISTWNNKDYEQHASCLSSDFYSVSAGKKKSYSQYLSDKKRLFSKYEYISVKFSNEHYAVLNAHEATISYYQTFKSPCYQSEGENTLYFTMLNGQVKISHEEFRRDSYNTMKCD